MPARAHGKTALTPWLFLLPFAAVFATFTLYPLVDSVRLAFHRPVGPTAEVYVGWSNFRELVADRQFWQALLRTAYFAVMSLVVQLPVALGMALLVDHRGLRGKGFFRTAFFVPVLIGPAFIGAAFKRIFGLQDGALNQLLGLVGLASIDWLRDPAVVMNTLVLVGVWMFAGFNMVYFLAGLQSVPAELYDAAKVDGAGTWQRFVGVTLPGIWPVAAFLMTASLIGSFGLFDLPWVLTDRGGPGEASTTVMVYLYKRGFIGQDLGYAAAIGWLVTVILLITSLLQLRITRVWSR
jgi:ABC-type sugar transport system permease subunit